MRICMFPKAVHVRPYVRYRFGRLSTFANTAAHILARWICLINP